MLKFKLWFEKSLVYSQIIFMTYLKILKKLKYFNLFLTNFISIKIDLLLFLSLFL